MIKDKLIDWKVGIPVACFGVLGAIIGANISIKMGQNNLKRYFGIFLSLIAIFEIYVLIKQYISDKKRHNINKE